MKMARSDVGEREMKQVLTSFGNEIVLNERASRSSQCIGFNVPLESRIISRPIQAIRAAFRSSRRKNMSQENPSI
jgi:hypothetical protein